VLAAADELRLHLTTSYAGVQFLQLLSKGAFPINVAYAGGSSISLLRMERRLAADVTLLDGPVQLALEYLHRRRIAEALATLDLQNITLADARTTLDPSAAVVVLHIMLAAGRTAGIRDVAANLADEYPDMADFLVIAAECAAMDDDDSAAAAYLAGLTTSGLPLMYRSYAMALRRASAYQERSGEVGANGDPVDVSLTKDRRSALEAVFRRLGDLEAYVDPASSVVVIAGSRPDKPSNRLGAVARMTGSLRRVLSLVAITLEPAGKLSRRRLVMSTTSAASGHAGSSDISAEVSQRGTPSTLALAVAVAALVIWVGFAIYLLANSGTDEVQWARLAWVFGSIEAVAFAAAGLLFGSTINRQRAEKAEARADANQQSAEGGRALSAALKADEPAVVREGRAGGPRPLGEDELDPAQQIAARHARLARELFP